MIRKETWDERYASGRYGSLEPHGLLIDLVSELSVGRALDLACGTGRHSVFLAEHGWDVVAVDSSTQGVQIAANRAKEKGLNIDFRVANLEKREFTIENDSYDLICDFYYLQHDLFAQMKKGVRPGGTIISTIHIYGEGEDSEGFLLKEGALREFFTDFDITHYHETSGTDMDAGEHHHRTAEIIARRPERAWNM